MLNSRHSSFTSQEETKCPSGITRNNYPSLSQSSIIELVINGEKCIISKNNPLFIMLHTLLRSVPSVTISKNKIISITLPNSLGLTKAIIEVYFQYLTISSSIPSLDIAITFRLVSLCLFFNDRETLEKIIQSNIEPVIDRYTSINILSQFYPYIRNQYKCFSELFMEIITKAINAICSNMFCVISNMRDALLQLDEEVFERIISEYFRSVLFNPNIDHSLVIGILMAKRDINDVFELLENERKDSISKFEVLLNDQMDPSLEWSIHLEDPSYGLYIESEEFAFDNIINQIIAYYDYKKDIFNIALKINDIKSDETDEDITFAQHQQVNNNDNSNYTRDKEDSSHNVNSNNLNTNSNQFIIALLSFCEIPELDFKLKINFNCIFSNSQTKVLISRIENFKQKFNERNLAFASGSVFTLKLFFTISYNFSSILTHICKNFYQYHSLPSIKIIPKNVLNIILRNEELNIQSEDEMLVAVLNWLNCRCNQSSELVLEIAKIMNWGLISVEGLFEFIQSQVKLMLGNMELQDIIEKEINSRFKKDNYIEDDNSFVESNLKIKRKYIPTSRYGSKKSFTSELLANILKLLSKNGNWISGNNPQTQSNMSNTITAIYQHDDNTIKRVSMNNSTREFSNNPNANACLIKNSMRNTKRSLSKRYKQHNSMKAISTNWKNIIVPMPVNNIDNPQYYKSERLKQTNYSSSAYNRKKLISSAYSSKSECSHKESIIQSKVYVAHKEDRCPNSLYPNYIKNASNSNYMCHSKPKQINHLNKKRKITNLIKIAKMESRENLKWQLKRSQSNLNSSSKNINSIHGKTMTKTRSFLD